MVFWVAGGLITGGVLVFWGAISGRLGKMLAALISPVSLTSAVDTPSDTGYQQLNIPQVVMA